MATRPSTTHARWFFLALLFGAMFLVWRMIEPFALALLTAGIFAVILAPLVLRIEKHLRWRWLSVFVVVALLVLLVLVPLFLIGLLIADQAAQIVQASLTAGSWLSTLRIADNPIFQAFPAFVQEQILAIDVVELGKRAAQWVVANLGDVASKSASFLFNGFIFLLALMSFLMHQEKIRDMILELSPLKDTFDTTILARMAATVRAVVLGALIIALVQSVLAAIGLTLFNVPGALLWGALVIIAAQIPTIGVGLVMLPAILYLVITGQYENAIGLAIWSTVVVGLVDNLLSPILLGARTNMPELLILLSVLGGLQLFGPIGFIIGPTVLATLMVLLELYRKGILQGK